MRARNERRFTNTGARMIRKYYAHHKQKRWNQNLNHPRQAGTSVLALAARFDVAVSTMWHLLVGDTYPDKP